MQLFLKCLKLMLSFSTAMFSFLFGMYFETFFILNRDANALVSLYGKESPPPKDTRNARFLAYFLLYKSRVSLLVIEPFEEGSIHAVR